MLLRPAHLPRPPLPPLPPLPLRLPRLPRLLRVSGGVAVAAVLVAGCGSSGGAQAPVAGGAPDAVLSVAGRPVAPEAPAVPVDARAAAQDGPQVATDPRVAAPRDVPAAAVLRSWDAARSRAFANGDVAALRNLYVAGSPAGASDVRLLRAYLRRGLRVEGMRMQVLALEVLVDRARRQRVRVTDRLAGAVAVGPDGRRLLPRDRASTRVVELRRHAGEWRVLSVRESARPPAGR